MNNQKNLYTIIVLLALLNVATISYFLGANRGFGYRGFGMMGMMGSDHHWEEHDEFETWEDMVEHMEEEHGEASSMHREINEDRSLAETHKNTYDFGQIKKSDGIVSTTFEIENHGKETLEIGEIATSCGCTTAEVDKKGLGFNEVATLTVNFDPNFHEEPQGKITRTVFVPTNDPDMPEMRFDVNVEILED